MNNKERQETIKQFAQRMTVLRNVIHYNNVAGVVVKGMKDDLKFYLPKEINDEILTIIKKNYEKYHAYLNRL